MTVLVADIGGTNVRFAVIDVLGMHDIQVMQVAGFPGPAEAAEAYLSKSEYIAKNGRPDRGVFDVAGPVTGDDMFELTNHPWRFSIEGTRKALGFTRFELINDFHAIALGILGADPSTMKKIGGGEPLKNGNIGIIGPGTGLGVASLVYDSIAGRYVAVAGEGPHVTAPAVTQREFDLFHWLSETRYSHVSAERVCSGKGLVNLYDAIRGVDKRDLPDLEPADIAGKALDQSCDASREALTILMAVLGRVAGNLALTNMTRGGVYFAGGILPKLGLPYILESRLRGEFTAKGRFTTFMDAIPTYLIDDPYLALRGLGTYAAQS